MRDLERPQQALREKRVRWQAGNVLIVHSDLARRWWKNASYHVEKGCFSCSIRADQSGDRAFLNGQARPVHRMEAAEMFVQIVNLDHHIRPFAKQPEVRDLGLLL